MRKKQEQKNPSNFFFDPACSSRELTESDREGGRGGVCTWNTELVGLRGTLNMWEYSTLGNRKKRASGIEESLSYKPVIEVNLCLTVSE